jgi:hypothetical protein
MVVSGKFENVERKQEGAKSNIIFHLLGVDVYDDHSQNKHIRQF